MASALLRAAASARLLKPLAIYAGNLSQIHTGVVLRALAPTRYSRRSRFSAVAATPQPSAVGATVNLEDDEHHSHPEVVRTRFPQAGTSLSAIGAADSASGASLRRDDPFPDIEEELGYVHSTESFSAVDGPGMRFLVFLQGCAFRCQFCSNPDTWAMNTGDRVSSKAIATKIDHLLPYLRTSGGGVTCSGGEAMLQPQFVAAIFREAHARGLNTCLDTTGQGTKHHHWDVILPHTDLALFCVKQMDPEKYLELTGHQQGNMLKFAEELRSRGIKTWCRYVLVPGLTDAPCDIERLVEFVRAHENMIGIELLPYHRLGVDKWQVMGVKYPLEGYSVPSHEHTRSVVAQLNAAGIKVLCDVPALRS